jgi:hypothetical protein
MRTTPLYDFVFVHRFETSEVDNPVYGGTAILVGGRVHSTGPAEDPSADRRTAILTAFSYA